MSIAIITPQKFADFCRSGSRGQQACEKFVKAGFSNVVNVEGGTVAYIEAGLPVVRGKKAISLERQVRIAAGSFVLLAALLGVFVNPAFVWLSAFIGAGPLFSGVTDTCGMGMILGECRGSDAKKPRTRAPRVDVCNRVLLES